MKKIFTKENIPRVCLVFATAILITVLGIVFKQSFIRILPRQNMRPRTVKI